jgi:outer membrane protein insertion porin family
MRAAVVILVLVMSAPAMAGGSDSAPTSSTSVDENAVTLPEFPPDPSFDPSYTIERIEVRGNAKTETALILRETGLHAGDVVSANDPRVALARLRLLALGFFLDVHLSLSKAQARGHAILNVEVEERGTVILDELYLGTSQATTLWGGLAATERNLLGRGIALGAGFVASTRPQVEGAQPGLAAALHLAGPPAFFPGRLVLQANVIAARGSELYRVQGDSHSADPDDFIATRMRRMGGTFEAGRALSRRLFLNVEVRFESIRAELPLLVPPAGPEPIAFGIHPGKSHIGSLAFTLDFDTRSDPVLPRGGNHVVLSVEGASDSVGSSYGFLKGAIQSSSYLPVRWGHVIGLHAFAGAIWGEAPYFDRFFVGDFNQLLPPRALGLNFSTQPSRDFLGTGIASHRYDNLAARALVEYAIPIWRRHGLLYRGDAFAAFGIFAMSNPSDLKDRSIPFSRALATDLTADLGLRLDTYVGIFTLSIGNAIGRIPF